MFRNPVLDFNRVLMVDMPFSQGSEWQHETRHRLGYMAVPGARLLVLDGLGPVGGLDHSPREYILVSSIVPRTALLGLLMLRAAQ